jgi:uncharacterized protein (TIGR02246 family)
MISQRLRYLIIGVAVACSIPGAAQVRLPPTNADQTVQQLIANVQTAMNTRNVERWAAEFMPDGRFITPSGTVLQGRNQIRADAAQVFGGVLKGASTAIRIDRVLPLGTDYAIVDATHFVRSLREPPFWAIETKRGTWQHLARYICYRTDGTDWQVVALQLTPIGRAQPAGR